MSLGRKCARAVGLAALGWTLACGHAGNVTTEPLELARGPVQRITPEPEPEPEPDAFAEPPDADAAGAIETDGPRRADVAAWLQRECSGCHAGDRYDDIDVLFEVGSLLAGAAEISPLLLWLQYGSSRRDHAGIRVSPEEFDTLVGYVNGTPAFMDCPGFQLVDRDQAYELMAFDISTREAADRPFIRYVGFARANRPRGCSTRPDQSGFLELLNGVSLSPTIVPPGELESADSFAPIYALDIRDYGWTLPIDVGGPGGRHFDDRWSAIVAAVGADALELTGPEADLLKRETRAAIPFLTAAQFVTAAAVGDLYSALVGVGDDVNAVRASLGVDDTSLWRAGVFGAAPLPDRVVTRREQLAFPGHAWWTREELSIGTGTNGLAEDPVQYPDQGAEIIFTLPNGLFAYALATSDGRSVNALPSCIGGLPCPTAVRAENFVTCRACHANGLNSVTDEVLPYLDGEPGRYPAALEPLIREQYRPDIALALEADGRVHLAAKEAASASLSFRATARLYFEHTRRALDALHAADELGVSIAQLRAGIVALGSDASQLAPLLSDGTLEREQLSPLLLPLSCSIEGLRNVPVGCP